MNRIIGSYWSLLTFFLSIITLTHCVAVEFNRNTTGAAFSAYIKKSEKNNETGTDSIPGWKTYSLEDVTTMLRVISTKFSKVATFGAGADNVKYIENETYFDSNAMVLAAEAAALINRESNSLNLTFLHGIWLSDIRQQMNTELRLTLECVRKANSIYPGTVQALLFSNDEMSHNVKFARIALQQIHRVKQEAKELGLKIGTRQNCKGIAEEAEAEKEELTMVRRQILNESDIIICEIFPASHNLPSGGVNGFVTVQFDLLGFRNEFQELYPNIEVMGQTGWASKGKESWENIDNLQDYWTVVSDWSTKHNMTMYLLESFDNPWKTWNSNAAHYGWWKLTSNSLTSKFEGYIEKINAPREEESKSNMGEDKNNKGKGGLSTEVYIGIAVGILIALFILTLIILLFLRVNKLQEALTKTDIREFMYGISENDSVQQGQNGQILESALKFPYDKSYEISKDNLKIKRDKLLGTGQFGAVYIALIGGEEKQEVALKMAKTDCPKSALKGLLSEIKILTYLGKHPNIVSICGAYTAELANNLVYVATELCTLGSLEGYLRNSQTSVNADRYANCPTIKGSSKDEIEFSQMIQWSHEIASGMEYLGCKNVVHADLATRNVLLSSDKTAKITDFGLSRRLYDYTNYVKKQQEPLPWRWMAIESLKRLEFSAQSDVWSYGVTLWEIFALGDLPYPGLSWNLDFVDSLVGGLRMKSPPHATPEVYNMMLDCWREEPRERPTFTDLKLTTSHLMTKGSPTKGVSNSEYTNF